ncbi:hypothetical protein FOA52_010476 [Chlamydomonas sp. UWO 241]|nr:hypothetical protein FOA52_010476 [Chlamydomonas sp. UWO 241]
MRGRSLDAETSLEALMASGGPEKARGGRSFTCLLNALRSASAVSLVSLVPSLDGLSLSSYGARVASESGVGGALPPAPLLPCGGVSQQPPLAIPHELQRGCRVLAAAGPLDRDSPASSGMLSSSPGFSPAAADNAALPPPALACVDAARTWFDIGTSSKRRCNSGNGATTLGRSVCASPAPLEGANACGINAVADAAGAPVVTPAEVRAAATHSKPGTAPGPDGIPVDVWRKLGEPAFVLLAAVFTAVGAAGETPPGFRDGVVASIYKAKDAADAANYRPLTMLGSDYRILAKVLATRWTSLLAAVVGPEQTAFLAGRRISDNICLTQMLPGLLAANAAEGVGPTGAALALLDFRKAYDTIDRGCLLAVMEAVGVGDGVLAWTRTILTHTYASAEVNGFISEPRRYAAGVRQGCPAAPALFLFLGHALACFLRTCPAVGVEVVPGCRVTCPQYADDCMPLLRSCAPAAVAALVEAMAVFGRATGLVLNLGKCGILPLGSAGEGLLAGAEVAGLRVLDAGVSLGVPVSAGLPPPEAVTGVCAGLRTLEAAVPGLWRLPLLSACKEPIWRLWARFAADRGQMITIVSAYSPTEAASDEEAGDFYLRVAALADKANDKRDLLIVAG